MYAFCRVPDPNSGRSKYVLINWTGEGVKDSRSPWTINARDEQDVERTPSCPKWPKQGRGGSSTGGAETSAGGEAEGGEREEGAGRETEARQGEEGERQSPADRTGEEARSLISQRSFNPRDVFKQKEQSFDDGNRATPAAPRPGKLRSPFMSQKSFERETPAEHQHHTAPAVVLPPAVTSPSPVTPASPVLSYSPAAALLPRRPQAHLLMRQVRHTTNLHHSIRYEEEEWSDEFEDDAEEAAPAVYRPHSDLYQAEEPAETENLYENIYKQQQQNTVSLSSLHCRPSSKDPSLILINSFCVKHEEQEAETNGQNICAKALYDYQAADDTEITFDPDDVITGIEMVDEGWWRGYGPDGHYGMFLPITWSFLMFIFLFHTKRRSDKFPHVITQRPDCGVSEEGKMAARLLLRSTVRAATACRVVRAARAPALTRCMASGGEDETGAETLEPEKARCTGDPTDEEQATGLERIIMETMKEGKDPYNMMKPKSYSGTRTTPTSSPPSPTRGLWDVSARRTTQPWSGSGSTRVKPSAAVLRLLLQTGPLRGPALTYISYYRRVFHCCVGAVSALCRRSLV
ncbi:hypothetical protein INR49_010971 [Caranx melampygus]|nr:hypothetical protein INR49_010971 [Caranx melampygus]